MSSRLFVTCVVDKAKVIKHWYAKPARSDRSIAELFSQLHDGDIDGRSTVRGLRNLFELHDYSNYRSFHT